MSRQCMHTSLHTSDLVRTFDNLEHASKAIKHGPGAKSANMQDLAQENCRVLVSQCLLASS